MTHLLYYALDASNINFDFLFHLHWACKMVLHHIVIVLHCIVEKKFNILLHEYVHKDNKTKLKNNGEKRTSRTTWNAPESEKDTKRVRMVEHTFMHNNSEKKK